MSINVRSRKIGQIKIQSGEGVPTHSAPLGSRYSDIDTGVWYRNLNGATSWEVDIAKKINDSATSNPAAGNDNTEGYSVGSLWINTTTDQAFICVDSSTGAAVWLLISVEEGDLAAIQFTTNVDVAISTTPIFIPFNTEILENDPSIIQQNASDNTRFDIGETGLYLLPINLINDATGGIQVTCEAVLNGTTIIDGTSFITNPTNNGAAVTPCVPVELTAGDYIQIRAFTNTGAGVVNAGSGIGIVRLKGVKGETGATGAGANIIVQKDDVTVGTVTSTLNFEGGGVSALDEGSGKTTITITSNGTRNNGGYYISTPATTVIAVVNTPVKVAGTTTTFGTSTNITNGSQRLTVDAGQPSREYHAIATISAYGEAAKPFTFYFAIDGVISTSTGIRRVLDNDPNKEASITIQWKGMLAGTNFIEVWAENNDDDKDLEVVTMQVTLKQV